MKKSAIQNSNYETVSARILDRYRQTFYACDYSSDFGLNLISGDDGPALREAIKAAITSAKPSRIVVDRDIRVVGDVTFAASNVTLSGVNNAHITFIGGGLLIDGNECNDSFLTGWSVCDLQVSRTGTAGPAIHMLDNGVGLKSPVRFDFSRVKVMQSSAKASGSIGIFCQGGFLGSFNDCYVHNCEKAVVFDEIITDDPAGVAANAINFFGGEIQDNTIGIEMMRCLKVGIYGTSIEGNSSIGVDIKGKSYAISIIGVYFEANGTGEPQFTDVVIGAVGGTSDIGVTLQDNLYLRGTAGAKKHAITVNRGRGISVTNETFTGYSEPPMVNLGGLAAKGRAWACVNVDISMPFIKNETGNFSFQYDKQVIGGVISEDSTRAINVDDEGQTIKTEGTGTKTYTVPLDATNNLRVGFTFWATNHAASSNVAIAGESGVTIVRPPDLTGTYTTTDRYEMLMCRKIGADLWSVTS